MYDTVTFFTTVYTVVDDLYQAELAPVRKATPGPRPRLSDSEVLTLIVAQHYWQLSERKLWRRLTHAWWRLFPTPISQSAFNRRVRRLASALAWLVARLAQLLGADQALYEVLDGTAVPLACRCRAVSTKPLAPDCNWGKGGSDRQHYWGCKLLLAVTPSGVISGFVAGPANTEERWLVEALCSGRASARDVPWTGAKPPYKRRNGKPFVGPTGPIWPRLGVGQAPSGAYLGDLNYTGAWWQAHWQTDYAAHLVTVDRFLPEDAAARQAHASLRQIVETVNGALKGDFGLGAVEARSRYGLRARIAGKLVAHNLCIHLNRLQGTPDLAMATLVA